MCWHYFRRPFVSWIFDSCARFAGADFEEILSGNGPIHSKNRRIRIQVHSRLTGPPGFGNTEQPGVHFP
jgi:hypothetical protein